MSRRDWKRVRPRDLRHAMELCLEHARDVRRMTVDRVADHMGLASKWTLYKWLESGRLPAVLIRPFEAACGATYVTQYVATSAGKLLIDIPNGRRSQPRDINALQVSFTEAVSALLMFADGDAEAEATIAALTNTLEQLAWQRANVERSLDPELDLFDGDAP